MGQHWGKNTNMYFNKISTTTLCFDVWFTYFLHGTGYLNCKIAQLGVLGIWDGGSPSRISSRSKTGNFNFVHQVSKPNWWLLLDPTLFCNTAHHFTVVCVFIFISHDSHVVCINHASRIMVSVFVVKWLRLFCSLNTMWMVYTIPSGLSSATRSEEHKLGMYTLFFVFSTLT